MPRKDLQTQRKILSWKTILPAVGLGLAGFFTPWLRLPNPVKAFFGFFVGGSLGYYISGNSASKESAAELLASSQPPLASEQKANNDTEPSQQKPTASVVNTQQAVLPTVSLQQRQTSESVVTLQQYPPAWKDFTSRLSAKQAYIIFKLEDLQKKELLKSAEEKQLAKNIVYALLQNAYRHVLIPQEPKHDSTNTTIQAHQGEALISKYLSQVPANYSDQIPDGTVIHRAEAFYIAYKSASNGGLLTQNDEACAYFRGERDRLKGPQSQPTPRPK